MSVTSIIDVEIHSEPRRYNEDSPVPSLEGSNGVEMMFSCAYQYGVMNEYVLVNTEYSAISVQLLFLLLSWKGLDKTRCRNTKE